MDIIEKKPEEGPILSRGFTHTKICMTRLPICHLGKVIFSSEQEIEGACCSGDFSTRLMKNPKCTVLRTLLLWERVNLLSC